MSSSSSQLTLLEAESDQMAIFVNPLPLKGDINYENAHTVLDIVRNHLDSNPAEVVLDLGEVEMIDSSGLKALLHAKRLCDESGVDFSLISASESISRIISLSGFSEFFGLDVHDEWPKSYRFALPFKPSNMRVYERQSVSDPSIISILRKVAMDAAEEAGMPAHMVCDVQIAVGEALTNAYRHGSPHKGVSKIGLRCMICSEALVVEILDEGDPFNPDAVSIPDPKKLRDHGMGIYLMRQAMDVVDFASNCPGNRVRMIKWLAAE